MPKKKEVHLKKLIHTGEDSADEHHHQQVVPVDFLPGVYD